MTNTMTKIAVAVGLIGSLAFSTATPSLARSIKGGAAPVSAKVLINTPKFDQRSSYADDQSFWHRYDGGMEGD